MQYLVTGATGFVGGRLTHQLLDAGNDVIVVARTPVDASDLAAAGATVVQGDVTDKKSMRDAMRDVDGVFHVAGWYRVGADDPSVGEAVNVDGTRNVMELVDELDVPKAVYTSTLAVNSDTDGRIVDESYRFDGQHLTIYDETKWRAHHEVVAPMAEAGLPVVTVLPGAVYGPGDTSQLGQLWRDYLTGDLPVIPRDVAYAWGHVDDIADAHVRAMEHGTPGEDYIICGETHTLTDAFAIAEDISGISAPRAVHAALFGVLSRVAGVVHPTITLPQEFRAETLRTLAGVTYLGDNTKAKRELGIEHRPFRDGLRDLLQYEAGALGVDAPAIDSHHAAARTQSAESPAGDAP